MNLKLQIVNGLFAVSRLAPDDTMPLWAMQGSWWSVTKTADELSVVCAQENIPSGVQVEKDWRIIKVVGPLDFALVGILSKLTQPLAEAGVSIFAVSTFDTDYLLVKEDSLSAATSMLTATGCQFI